MSKDVNLIWEQYLVEIADKSPDDFLDDLNQYNKYGKDRGGEEPTQPGGMKSRINYSDRRMDTLKEIVARLCGALDEYVDKMDLEYHNRSVSNYHFQITSHRTALENYVASDGGVNLDKLKPQPGDDFLVGLTRAIGGDEEKEDWEEDPDPEDAMRQQRGEDIEDAMRIFNINNLEQARAAIFCINNIEQRINETYNSYVSNLYAEDEDVTAAINAAEGVKVHTLPRSAWYEAQSAGLRSEWPPEPNHKGDIHTSSSKSDDPIDAGILQVWCTVDYTVLLKHLIQEMKVNYS